MAEASSGYEQASIKPMLKAQAEINLFVLHYVHMSLSRRLLAIANKFFCLFRSVVAVVTDVTS